MIATRIIAGSTMLLAATLCAVPHAVAKSRASYSAIVQDSTRVAALFRSLDANGDGQIKFHEVGGADLRIEVRFELADGNHDGQLDRDEFEALLADLARKELSARR